MNRARSLGAFLALILATGCATTFQKQGSTMATACLIGFSWMDESAVAAGAEAEYPPDSADEAAHETDESPNH